jgi:hypothetical protein
MSISLTNYVNIFSGQGAGIASPTRDLYARFFTSSLLLPPQSFVQFTSAAQVAAFFGSSSEEYARAVFYFGFVSKNLVQAGAIQFARWVSAAVAPMIFSAAANTNALGLSAWTSISNGSFILTIGGVTNVLNSLDFHLAADLPAVAAIIESAIQAETGSGAMWTGATVTYSPLGYSNSGFTFTGGLQTLSSISVTAGGTGTDITGVGLLGWVPAITIGVNSGLISGTGGAIWATGSPVETLADALNTSINNSNNFGSFAFLNNLNLTLSQVIQIATWNITAPVNVNYLYCIPVSRANYTSWAAVSGGVGGIGSCCMTLQSNNFTFTGLLTSAANTVTGLQTTIGMTVGMSISGTNIPANTTVVTINSTNNSLTMSANATGSGTEVITFYPFQFPEQLPMMIEAATNYAGLNSVQNYMFQVDNTGSLTPSVTSDTDATALDALFVNYYGSTQTAGTIINFYQRGAMMGQNVPSNIPDITSYVNEVWFKDAAGAAIMTLLLALSQIPANTQGEVQIIGALQGVINQAVNNGTVSVGKTLTAAQITYITAASSDNKAWYQVQNLGYWLNCVIQPNLMRPGEYEAVYTLIYSKDDTIRYVSGTQTLI